MLTATPATSRALLRYLQADFTNVRERMAAVPLVRHEQGTRFFDEHDAAALCTTLLGSAPVMPRRWPEAASARAVDHWESEWDVFNGPYEACGTTQQWCAETRAWVQELPLRGIQLVHTSFWETDVHPMAAGGSGARAVRIFDLSTGSAVVFSAGTHARVFFTCGERTWEAAALDRLK